MAETKFSVYQKAIRFLGDARLNLPTDDVEVRYLLDDAWAGAVEFVLKAAPWRFAMKSPILATTTGPIPGYLYAYTQPTDWLATYRIFVIGSLGAERPVEVRHQALKFHANSTDLHLIYVSSDYLDPAFAPWPEDFATTVAAYLAFEAAKRIENSAAAAATMSQIFSSTLSRAVKTEGLNPDPWLSAQLDGSFDSTVAYLLSQGYWRYALETISFAASLDPVDPPPVLGYPYSYPMPDDHVRTHAVFIPSGDGREFPVDVREDGRRWSTAAPYVGVRYLSQTRGHNPAVMPDTFFVVLQSLIQLQNAPDAPQQTSQTTGQAVPAAGTYRNLLAAALAVSGEPEDPFYRFQRSGAFQRACFHVAETGRWKFAIATVTLEANAKIVNGEVVGTFPENALGDGSISPSYSAVYLKPNDWLRTIWIYRTEPGNNLPTSDSEAWPRRLDVDYRDEAGCWHTHWTTIQVRYIRRAAIDSPRWPQSYANAVQAWLEYEEMKSNLQQTAAAGARLKLYEDALLKAEAHDDAQDRPPYRTVGRFVRGRYGWLGRGEQGRSRA